MTNDARLRHRPPPPPEGPPPIGAAPPPAGDWPGGSGGRNHEWLSQRQGLRLAYAALALPVLLVLAAYAAMLWFVLAPIVAG